MSDTVPERFPASPGSANLGWVEAVVCYRCGCMGRSDEMEYFDHGDETKGWTCEWCQERDREAVRAMCERFQKVRAEVKAAEGSGKDSPNEKMSHCESEAARGSNEKGSK